jgi:hypothetical protein
MTCQDNAPSNDAHVSLAATSAHNVPCCLVWNAQPACVGAVPLPMEVLQISQVHVFKTKDEWKGASDKLSFFCGDDEQSR